MGKEIAEFGAYPQSRVYDEKLIEKLTVAAGALPKNGKFGKWTSFRFYMKNVKSDYMWYTDIELDGNKYRGVYIERLRPYHTNGDSDKFEESGHQGYLGYRRGRTYWFVFEPIEFEVLDTEYNGAKLVYSKYVLDAMQFANLGPWRYVSYEDSEIREWLNNEFLSTAFSNELSGKLCEFEQGDKVSFLSVEEYEKYCRTGEGWRSEKRMTTDYAQCMGVDAESAYGICNFYWLRTVKEEEYDAVFYGVGTLGNIENMCYYSNRMGGGVAPAILIKQ